MSKKLLLVTDSVSYGKLGMSAQLPFLSRMGYDIYTLPTALVSNNFNYGDYAILNTTEYMAQTVATWIKLGFYFDIISIGFIPSSEQVGIIERLVEFSKIKNPSLFVALDPIMGDAGKLYAGIDNETVVAMREVCKFADVITPNLTEACFLADMFVGSENISHNDAMKLAQFLGNTYNTKCVITSMSVDNKKAILIYDGECEFIYYEEIPQIFYGTGDFFSAYFVGLVMRGVKMDEATQKASAFVKILIEEYAGKSDALQGIAIEEFINKMDL